MTTTIKVSDETKQLLDVLQAKMTLTIRKKKTLTELIDTITRIAMKHEDELLQAGKLPPLEKDPAMKPPIDWGIKTDASKVDEYIYTED
ncbi:MAG: hypothetical protein ABOK23_09340 [Candidatus Methanoperedens sp.]|nr:hypothetical protein [Candidatus Methanoperedens sp.]MCZ7394332.1 hypothetical protein [Candidatus Methanoperedens sp.]